MSRAPGREAVAGLAFRDGTGADLRTTFAIQELAYHATAASMGVVEGPPPDAEKIAADWEREGAFVEFISAQPGGCYIVCEDAGEPVAYARVCRFGEMEELTELMVLPSHHRRGIGRELLERCWPGDPTPDLGRCVVAIGATADLTLYTDFGVMPVAGHWDLRVRGEAWLEARTRETMDGAGRDVHQLSPDRAIESWNALEPPAIGHRRPRLHEFFGRTRTCLATLSDSGDVSALCWIGSEGEIGPAVAASPDGLVPVVLSAIDRVVRTRAPEEVRVAVATDSWWLLRRLRQLGFRVARPSWVMSSIPLPGLDRYMPTRPAHLL